MLAPIITEPRFYLFAIPAVIFLGLAKGGLSGVATAATPLLALYLPPLEAAALLLPLLLCQDAISVRVYWREWSAWNLKVLLPGAALGVMLGWLFASHVSNDAIRILIGITALGFVSSVWIRRGSAKKATAQFWAAFFGGLFAASRLLRAKAAGRRFRFTRCLNGCRKWFSSAPRQYSSLPLTS